jgi:hypothetical protein
MFVITELEILEALYPRKDSVTEKVFDAGSGFGCSAAAVDVLYLS